MRAEITSAATTQFGRGVAKHAPENRQVISAYVPRVVNISALLFAVFAMGLIAVGEARASADPPSSEAGAEGHGEHAGEPNLNPLDPNDMRMDLALWTGVIFVLLLLVLGKFAWGPIADGLDKREQSIAGEIAAAEKANADAKAQLDEYQQKLATAGDEVRQLIEQGKRDAESIGETIVEKARGEAEAEKRRAVEDIELATAGALKELAEESANMAVDLAGKIVRRQLSADQHTALINEAVGKFSQMEPGKN